MTHKIHLQDTIVSQLTQILSQDGRVKALWLKGSLGRGQDADRHSDIDLHVWVKAEHMQPFLQDLPGHLEEVRPLLHLHPLFDGHMNVILLQAAPQRVLALDVFLDTDENIELDEANHKVLFDREGLIQQVEVKTPTLPDLKKELEVQIRLFWRLFAMLPSIERGELIQAMKRLTDEVEVALQICSLGRRRFRDIGENRGNELMLLEEQKELEHILAVPHLSVSTVVEKHLRLAEFVAKQGRTAASLLDTSYPEQLEDAVLDYVHAELQRMRLNSVEGKNQIPEPTAKTTLYMMCGLPGSGKTTRAKEIERQAQALRLTTDEWMLTLFGQQHNTSELLKARDTMDILLWNLAKRALQLGTHVVLDYGLWSREERQRFKAEATSLGASTTLIYLEAPLETLWARIDQRNQNLDGSYPITRAELELWSTWFESPTPEELPGS